jgi:hypothetical protein
VRGVDEGRPAVGEESCLLGLGGGVVPQISGEIDVHARPAYVAEEAVAGAAAHGDGTDRLLRVARDPQPGGGVRQALGRPLGELRERERSVEFADPAQAPAARRVGRVGHQRAGHPQPHGCREGVGDPRIGPVGVGVGDVQRDIVLDQGVHDPALEAGGRHGRRATQIEGVVGDEQIGSRPYRLVRDLVHRIHGEEHPRHLGLRIAAHQADGIPLLGPLRGPEGFERGNDNGQFGHGSRLPRWTGAYGITRGEHTGSSASARTGQSPPLQVNHTDSCRSVAVAKTNLCCRR